LIELVEIAGKIGLSALLAGAVGAEREWTGKWAGLRTHMLIAVGAALLTDVSVNIGVRFAAGSAAWDPARISAQIVSGIGFLGAGTIIQARGTVHGLTTAAGLWVAAAIGLAVGARFYIEATVATVVLLVILVALRPVEAIMLRGNRRQVVLELGTGFELDRLSELIEESGAHVEHIEVSRKPQGNTVRITIRGSAQDRERLVTAAAERGISAAGDDDD
jgi:putative Mg2+ transporter-C (MgtC) family protein